jgi:hypothetical protein
MNHRLKPPELMDLSLPPLICALTPEIMPLESIGTLGIPSITEGPPSSSRRIHFAVEVSWKSGAALTDTEEESRLHSKNAPSQHFYSSRRTTIVVEFPICWTNGLLSPSRVQGPAGILLNSTNFQSTESIPPMFKKSRTAGLRSMPAS